MAGPSTVERAERLQTPDNGGPRASVQSPVQRVTCSSEPTQSIDLEPNPFEPDEVSDRVVELMGVASPPSNEPQGQETPEHPEVDEPMIPEVA